MIHLSDFELQTYVQEDLPFFDLTTMLQEMDHKRVTMEIFTREDVVVACSDDASRIAKLYGCEVKRHLAPKSHAQKGETLISIEGDYNHLQSIYRTIQVLLEYSCKIASYTHAMKNAIEEVNPKCELLATRKTFPFAKKFCIKSVMSGGAMPHRLSLSESILFFGHHRRVYESEAAFYDALTQIKSKSAEKKIVVESSNFEDAAMLMQSGADVLQIEKSSIELLEEILAYRDAKYADVKILATGGIKLENVKKIAATGVDGVVTSALYACGMADMGSRVVEVR